MIHGYFTKLLENSDVLLTRISFFWAKTLNTYRFLGNLAVRIKNLSNWCTFNVKMIFLEHYVADFWNFTENL